MSDLAQARKAFLLDNINSMARILSQSDYSDMSQFIVEICSEGYTYRVYGTSEDNFEIVEK